MSKNIKNIYDSQPATSMIGTDLMYLGRSPYDATDDRAILWSNMLLNINSPAGTNVTTATYTTLAADNFLAVNRNGTVAITLDSTLPLWYEVRIKDVGAHATANNITITPSAGTVDGLANYVFNVNYQMAGFKLTGTNLWSVF